MRTFLLLSVVVATASGCHCSPATPQPVTLRVVNTTRFPIYVDGTQHKLGLTVQREVAGELFPFDDLACECRACAQVCSLDCECPDAGGPQVFELAPDAREERTWDGVIRMAGNSRCGECLDAVNAPLNEPFTLELCFSVQRPAGLRFDDAGVAEGAIPVVTRQCTTKSFTPQDLVVELGPPRGAACTQAADCRGAGELCFDGACTTGCPANDFPAIGSDWLLNIASADNMGFFEQTARTRGSQFQGTGTLTSVVYQSNTLSLAFSRTSGGETLTGRVQIKLPVGTGAPLSTGAEVTATLVDDGASRPARAFVMRDAASGELLFAADMVEGTRLLTPQDLAPFQVGSSAVAAGCTQDACGRFVQSAATLSDGATSVSVLPGATGKLPVGQREWTLLNVGNGRYDGLNPQCEVSELRPFVFWRSKP